MTNKHCPHGGHTKTCEKCRTEEGLAISELCKNDKVCDLFMAFVLQGSSFLAIAKLCDKLVRIEAHRDDLAKFVTEVRDQILYPLAQEETKRGAQAECMGSATVGLLNREGRKDD